jgi:DNA-binding GntR family transcriptional regulator
VTACEYLSANYAVTHIVDNMIECRQWRERLLAEGKADPAGGSEHKLLREAALAFRPKPAYIYRPLPMRTSKAHPAKPDRGISASKRVEAHLRKAIHAGKLRPRQRIIEEDLARELDVSRGPVREALLRLERDGLVVTTSRRGTFIRDISLAEIGVIFRMRAKLEGLCVRYFRENASIDAAEILTRALKKLKTAAAKNSEEQFFQADMELHRTIWKAANQPLLYRTLNLLMNPYIFIIARAYSSRIPLANRRDNHEQYVRMILKTPLDKIEEEVERYFEGLHSRIFDQSPAFPAFATDHWADELESTL